jgi:hypothetical protein
VACSARPDHSSVDELDWRACSAAASSSTSPKAARRRKISRSAYRCSCSAAAVMAGTVPAPADKTMPPNRRLFRQCPQARWLVPAEPFGFPALDGTRRADQPVTVPIAGHVLPLAARHPALVDLRHPPDCTGAHRHGRPPWRGSRSTRTASARCCDPRTCSTRWRSTPAAAWCCRADTTGQAGPADTRVHATRVTASTSCNELPID